MILFINILLGILLPINLLFLGVNLYLKRYQVAAVSLIGVVCCIVSLLR